MKLPRWLVIAMLTTSVLAVLAAVGWWWVTWPERTAREFVACIIDARFDQANDFLEGSAWRMQPDRDGSGRMRIHLSQGSWSISNPPGFWELEFSTATFGPRTPNDILLGRLLIRVTMIGAMMEEMHFIVIRGTVRYVDNDES